MFNVAFSQQTDIFSLGKIQVIVAGKLRAQRAKSMKFRDGYMIKSGRVREGECIVKWRRCLHRGLNLGVRKML